MKFNSTIAKYVMGSIFGTQLGLITESTDSRGSAGSLIFKRSGDTGSGTTLSGTYHQGCVENFVQMLSDKELWLGLCTEEPTCNSAGIVTDAHELNPNNSLFNVDRRNYSRVNITKYLSTTYQSHSNGDDTMIDHHYYRVGNIKQLSFDEAIRAKLLPNVDNGGDWQTAAYWAIWTQQTDGLPFVWGALEEPTTVDTHEVFIIRSGHMEVYLEPDKEYLYYGFFSSLSDFQTALDAAWYVDEAGDKRPFPVLPEGLNAIKTNDSRACQFEITAGAANKYLFFASPVDFRGVPMFRKPWESTDIDEYGDLIYTDYAYEQSNTTTYTGSYFKGTPANGLTALTQVPTCSSAPAFTENDPDYPADSYIGPYYTSEGVEVGSKPPAWDTTYMNYYYYPNLILVSRENAYFSYQVFSGVPTKVATPTGNPSTNNYYEARNLKVNQFVKSTDSTCVTGKTYYAFTTPTWAQDTYNIRVY